MSSSSKIEWTERTWNPVTGCTKVSPGCDRCYAETFAERWRGVPAHPFEQGFDLTFHPERLDMPLAWRASRIFVNSMSDLFHRDIPDEFVARVFATMLKTPKHTYQVLTKRPDRMRHLIPRLYDNVDATIPRDHVWLGVSIESNDYAWRADMLRGTPASVRWISAEPLLGPLDRVDLTDIDWLVIGGESGHGARPLDLGWIRDLIQHARAAGTSVFVKQLGAVAAREQKLGDRKGGDMEAWPDDLRVREYPQLAAKGE